MSPDPAVANSLFDKIWIDLSEMLSIALRKRVENHVLCSYVGQSFSVDTHFTAFDFSVHCAASFQKGHSVHHLSDLHVLFFRECANVALWSLLLLLQTVRSPWVLPASA